MNKLSKFEKEKMTVEKFYSNNDINTTSYNFTDECEEPCDIRCENTGEKFQVTWNEHEFQGKIRTQKGMVLQGGSLDKYLDQFILEPINKKISLYGKSARGIILLVI